MSLKIDIIGQRFDRLVVIKELPRAVDAEGNLLRTKRGKLVPPRYLCQCDCGNTCEANRDHLRYGSKRSCGCKREEFYADSAERMAKAREARKQQMLVNKEPRCPYPCASCKDSMKGLCCHDCSVRSVCDYVCMNRPDKCGYKKVR